MMKLVRTFSLHKAVALALAGAAATCAAQTTNVPPSQLKAFELVYTRNIFNPNRTAKYVTDDTPTKHVPKVDVVALAGTMVYERGAYAFFSSTDSRYQGVLGPKDEVAGYRISDIGFDYVILSDPNAPQGPQDGNSSAGPTHAAATPPALTSAPDANLVVVERVATNSPAASNGALASASAPVAATNDVVGGGTNIAAGAAANDVAVGTTNQPGIRLAVGSQLRREEGGSWTVVAGGGNFEHAASRSGGFERGGFDRGGFDRGGNDRSSRNNRSSRNSSSSYVSPSASSSSSSSSSSASDSEVLQRLMKKREQELNK